MTVHNSLEPAMMRGCGVRSAGGPVELMDLPRPGRPGPGQVVVSVAAAGIGAWDQLLHRGGWDVGLQPPAALGVEGTGTVAALGPGVGLEIGDPVVGHEAPLPGGSGFWAEQVLVTASHLVRRPDLLDAGLAGGLPVAGLTAWQALEQLEVQPGSRLLVTGGSGVTGMIAVQLAVQRGVEVVATAASRHVGRLRRLGAARVLDSHGQNWADGLAPVFDAALVTAKKTSVPALTLVRDGGRLCSITSNAPPGRRGIASANLYVQPDAGQLAAVLALAAHGRLELSMERVSLADTPDAAARVADGLAGGMKFVLSLEQADEPGAKRRGGLPPSR